MRAEDVVMLVEAVVGRRRRDGEVVLVEGVVSAGKELLEMAENNQKTARRGCCVCVKRRGG